MSDQAVSITDNAVEITEKATEIVTTAGNNGFTVENAYNITSNVITLMGMSFILGVLFTTFILLVLDFMRRNQPEE